ncbi:HyaD/HybD family hydrogenase maturation endopeptidase [Sedimenticola selenatireducens]|uniref:HyaD/HybD family hydrogenase maturation endopeptidase n=1 Tax=Sedimenticola selenatireducens TaxID=191960 RepID=A0A558DWP7_9GAMM|nr:HyaD/HybD family hydrogenase maturation endopeptidase [Sedimenticola selenatireducens]TVO75568.1 HyaD/HybD family hydrogenase maturation endopeptidase [Sedimenticola selenatireducens]TVT65474.1 MAG: HyaD/HybD family hydrogenase maturation endopeptidase [Sedimenticola selenatireducens]
MSSTRPSVNDVNRPQPNVLILGIGNLLWADEGFGVRAVETLQQWYRYPDHVRVMDGGTQGVYLVQEVREADILIVFDAIDYGLSPGTLKLIEGEAVPKYLGVKKISLHQTGFQEVLALAEMMGDYPEKLLLIGVQPVEIEDFGGSLHPKVKTKIGPAIEQAIAFLSEQGVVMSRREKPMTSDILSSAISDMTRYEHERPPPEQACRLGDERVLLSGDYQVGHRPVSLEGSAMSVGLDQHLNKYRSQSGS